MHTRSEHSFLPSRTGLCRTGGACRLAVDPAVFDLDVPSSRRLLRSTAGPAQVGRGQRDAIVTRWEYVTLGFDPPGRAGVGHNAQVENAAGIAARVRLLLHLTDP